MQNQSENKEQDEGAVISLKRMIDGFNRMSVAMNVIMEQLALFSTYIEALSDAQDSIIDTLNDATIAKMSDVAFETSAKVCEEKSE